MSNPLVSFGSVVGSEAVGVAYEVQVPAGNLSQALKIPLAGDQDDSGVLRDLILPIAGVSSILAALDAAVPVGSTLRTNVYNETQNTYLIDLDIAAGNTHNSTSSSALAITPGDKVWFVCVDTTGSGFTISRLQWQVKS